MFTFKQLSIVLSVFSLFIPISLHAGPQALGNAGNVTITVTDATGAVIPGASAEIQSPRSGYKSDGSADANGTIQFRNLPFNSYHLSVSSEGFKNAQQDVDVRSSVPVILSVNLDVGAAGETVNVEASDLIEAVPTTHTDVDSTLIDRLPSDSVNSSLFSVISQATPGVAQDSNGLSHPQGEHADTTFSIDGQPVSDQQTRIYSNAISANAVQSMEVINGVPPAEYGDKASMVVRTTTKSGLGVAKPTGSFSAEYGSFGTAGINAALSLGNQKFGNFIAIDGNNSGRFLDPPEFYPIHAHGNAENIFDRIDYQINQKDSLHVNLIAGRSWFQIPNSIEQFIAGQDQRQQNRNFDISPSFTHLMSAQTLITVNAYIRQDRVNYYPSANVFHDLPATLNEGRRLTNTGLKTDISYAKGMHNFKAGADFYHTFLSEQFGVGVTDPAFNALCLNPDGSQDTGSAPTNQSQCVGRLRANPGFLPGLLPFDLTRGGSEFGFRGHSDIKQFAAYAQDVLTLHNLTLSLGIRGDVYRGISLGNAAEPRVGASYLIKKTNTAIRGSYGRFFLTPYNENLILSSATGEGGLAQNVFGAFAARPLQPGRRNYYTAGVGQALGKYMSVDADYFWKYSDPDYDFDVILNTSLTFPIQWKKSKIDGAAVRVNVPDFHGLSAYSVLGHTRSRFFGPEIGGIIFNNPANSGAGLAFRIDHDQTFQQVTHVQYQLNKNAPWFSFTWNYQSGLVAGRVPLAPDANTPVNLTGLSADQQIQAGLFCGGTFPTLSAPLSACAPSQYGSTRITLPKPGTDNPDTNPARIAPRNTFDVASGLDNLFHTEKYKVTLRLSVINVTNKVALYNFLSTFSGTHFIPPRSYTAQLGFTF
ncbi:MAG: hypothetical protein NVS1B11_20030 [Terriglobales bacterium]